MLNNRKLYIFDIDGTLTDSVSLYHQVIIDTLKELGIQKIDTNFNDYLHHTDSYALKLNFEQNFSKSFDENLLNKFDDELEKEFLTHPKVSEIKGAKKAIEYLKTNNQSFCFATGSLPKPAHLKLDQCNIWNDRVLISTSLTSYDREGFVLEAIEKAKVYYNVNHFDEIISVGDGIWDLKTAQNLELNFIGIGLKNKELLLQNGCLNWFENMESFQTNLLK
jgi:phosphoglycolate phosphatase-like HAD superfamily hydrolase